MEIPEYVVAAMFKVVDDHPEITHAAVRSDKLGGWFIDYTKSKAAAERITAGQVDTEVVEFAEEGVLCLTTKMAEL